MPEGIIIKGIGGFYYVNSQNKIYECKARGIFRKNDISPLPGDNVVISIEDEATKKGNIEEILPRNTLLIRPAVANVNQIVIVIAVKAPNPDLLLLDKLLVTFDQKTIRTIICINKIDLDENNEFQRIKDIYINTGYTVLAVSTKQNSGFEVLKDYLKDHVTVFAGQSGVGKSTIINNVIESWVMETGSLSEKNERGKHTTRHAELIELTFGGFIVDTPGFSSFELSELTHKELQLYFPEMENYLNNCRFPGCSHINEPDCRVKEALESKMISAERYKNYVSFYETLKLVKNYKERKK